MRVNAINPGWIATDRLSMRIAKFAEERNRSFDTRQLHEWPNKLRIKRFGEPVEIAAAVAFLASEMSDYCQGTILDVDGGSTKTL